MPKSTHQHQKDSINTDKKFRPDDEATYTQDKQDFQASEKAKKGNEEGAESSISEKKNQEE